MTIGDATTNEILDFLHENMVTKEEFKIDLKVNKILELLERHRLAPTEEIHAIRDIQIFPVPPAP